MIFEPGKDYYVLDPTQYSDMISLISDEGLSYDLSSDFQLSDDGNYYVAVDSGSVDPNEYSFLEDWGFLNVFSYKKSTQSTSPV